MLKKKQFLWLTPPAQYKHMHGSSNSGSSIIIVEEVVLITAHSFSVLNNALAPHAVVSAGFAP